jgi:hypothetical protein
LTAGESSGGVERIVIELETPGHSRSTFRLRPDDAIVSENLTAAQAHRLVGEILDRITLPRRRSSGGASAAS